MKLVDVKTKIKIRFCAVRDDNKFLCDVRNPPDGIPYIPTVKNTFNKRALRRGGAQIYVQGMYIARCRAADTFCNQTLLHRSIYTTNRKSRSPPSSIGLRYVQGVSARLSAYLDDSISSYEEGTGRGIEKRQQCGPNVVGLYRKDTIRGDLILAPVYEYERMDTRSGGKSKKDLRLIIISRRDAGADISRGNHCGIRSNERRS